MIQGLETSLGAGAVPQPPQFRPAPAPVGAATVTRPLINDMDPRSTTAPEVAKTAGNVSANDSTAVQPARAPAAAAAELSSAAPTISTKLAAPPESRAPCGGDSYSIYYIDAVIFMFLSFYGSPFYMVYGSGHQLHVRNSWIKFLES
jgi:hypothetical protein